MKKLFLFAFLLSVMAIMQSADALPSVLKFSTNGTENNNTGFFTNQTLMGNYNITLNESMNTSGKVYINYSSGNYWDLAYLVANTTQPTHNSTWGVNGVIPNFNNNVLMEGNYTLSFIITTNWSVNTSLSNTSWFYVDVTKPVFSTYSFGSYANASNLSASTGLSNNVFYINGTITEAVSKTNSWAWVKGNTTFDAGLINSSTGAFNISNASKVEDGTYDLLLYINDSAKNERTTSLRFIFDTTAPTGNSTIALNSSTTTDMFIVVSAVASDIVSLINYVYVNMINIVTGTITPSSNFTYNETKGILNVTVGANNISNYGVYNFETVAVDYSGNTVRIGNSTNWTVTKLYNGWQPLNVDKNTTMLEISNLSTSITQVSVFAPNVSGSSTGNWTTFVRGASSNNHPVLDGNSVFVYSTGNITLFRQWRFQYSESIALRTSGFGGRNQTLYAGFNLISFYNNSMTLNDTLFTLQSFSNASAGTGTQVLKYMSCYNPLDRTYYPIRKDFNWNANITLVKGVNATCWVHSNGTIYLPIVRP